MEIAIEAVQVAESFNIKKFRSDFRTETHSGSTSEVFYVFEDTNRYLYIFDYGIVVFGNYDPVAKSEFLNFIKNYADNLVNLNLFDPDFYLFHFCPLTVYGVTKLNLQIKLINLLKNVRYVNGFIGVNNCVTNCNQGSKSFWKCEV